MTSNMYFEPAVYSSLKNNTYLSKNDVFAYIRHTVLGVFPNVGADKSLNARITRFLTEKERLMKGYFEFIRESEFETVKSQLQSLIEKNWSLNPRGESIKKSMNGFAEKLGMESLANVSDEKMQTLDNLYIHHPESKKHAGPLCSILMKSLQELLENRPDVFLPSSKGQGNVQPIVRLFQDGNRRFVMIEELEMVLNGTRIPCALTQNPPKTWKTIDGSAALRMALNSGRNIEFLKTPIRRIGTRYHSSYANRTPNGKLCRLAVDALFLLVQSMLFEYTPFPFDKNSINEKQHRYFLSLLEYFPADATTIFFIEESTFDMLREQLNEDFKDDHKVESAEEVRKIKEHRAMDGKKMVAALIAEYSGLAQFVHNQKACDLLYFNECCGKKIPEEEKSEEETTETVTPEEPARDTEETPVVAEVKKTNKKKRSKVGKIQAATSEESLASEVPEVSPQVEKIVETSVDSKVMEPEVPQEIKESSACQKCFRTAERCKEAKEKLKEAENLIKKLTKKTAESERKQSKAEKELEELKRKFAAYQEEQEVQQNALKLQLTQSEEEKELLRAEKKQLQVEKDQLVEENKKVQEQFALDQHVPEPVNEEEEEEDPIDYEKMLDDLQDKYLKLNEADPLGDAVRKVRKLKGLTEDEQVQMFAESELEKFQEHYLEYTSALEGNMNAIQTDNFSSVIPLPDYPKLSEKFEEVLGKAQEKRNKELELECVICTVEMDLEKKEELFKCPGCKKFTHLHCIETWFKKSPNCPHCRATWN